MEYGIVIFKQSTNYGDDIQSYAAQKLLPKVHHYIDREKLNSFENKSQVKTICNGWFISNPLNWPPSDQIDPLFISMHVSHNNNAIQHLISKRHYNYYKKHEPIGCRDYHTMNQFKSIGIDSYYSGCITLTLGDHIKKKENSEEILFVDAINKNMPEKYRQLCLSGLIPDSIKDHVVFINHTHHDENLSVKNRIMNAELLLQRYANAHLVVTSRIHCALPCIALGTPVLFLDVGFNLRNSRNRFGGIIEYFNRIDNSNFAYSSNNPFGLFMRKLHLYKYYFKQNKISFDWDNPPANPIDIRPIRDEIKLKVASFINS